MPPSWLRRPSVVLLAAFCALLVCKRGRGPFCARPAEALFAARRGARLRVYVEQPPREDRLGVWAEGRSLDHPGQRLRLKWKGAALFDAPLPGETVELDCRVARPRLGKNPGDFDERRHLEDRGVQWVADCERPFAVHPPESLFARLRFAAERLRRFLEREWRRRLPALDARLTAGLVLGYKGPLERELNRDAQDAGVIHLLVPSGAKVAVVVLAVEALCALLRAPPRARLLAVAATGGFFTLVVGGEPPYVRAWLAACLSRGGALLERDAGAFQAAVFAAWLQLLWDPAALFTLGFQMTYACAFVLSATPGKARSHLLVTALVEAALWPILCAGFGRAAVLGALANVPLVPLSLPLTGAAWLTAAGSRAAAWALSWGLAVFREACARFSDLPYAAADVSPMGPAAAAAFYLALAALLVRFAPRTRAALLSSAAALWLGQAAHARYAAPELSVLYLSRPGFRAAALVRRGAGVPVLVTDRRAEAQLRKAARAYGWAEPAAVVSLRERPGYRACEGKVCLRFDQPCFHGPSGEFCILALLKRHAVEVSTDGSSVQIRQASDQLRRRLL